MKTHSVSCVNIANLLTFLRLLLIPVFLRFLLGRTARSSVIALIVFLFASITDYLDGLIARKHHLQTSLGEFMDPLVDKLLVCSAFIAFACIPALHISWWLVALIIAREVFVTGMRVVALRKKAPIRTEFSGKIKTFFQMVTIVVILVLLILRTEAGMSKGPAAVIPSALVALSAVAALISMVQYIIKNRHIFSGQVEH
jgi:CDP-diacylglycerol--glycerol-3-phosphate 3-phosphatidyltransferase